MFEIKSKNIVSLLGNRSIIIQNSEIFQFLVSKFFLELSNKIFKDPKFKKYPDIISYAFWIREGNLANIKKSYNVKNELYIGRGLVFHVVPSNVPTNFIYSLTFGLLSGNSNIIKLPEKNFIQIDLLLGLIQKILKNKNFIKLKNNMMFLRYNKKHHDITKYISLNSDVRIVWGGDKTVMEIKKFPTKPTAIDINFPDKYSLCIIDTNDLKINFKKLVNNFYNDTFLYDQNACSSPHLVLWYGKKTYEFKKIFWNELSKIVKLKYDFPRINNLEKLEKKFFDQSSLTKNIKIYDVNKILMIATFSKLIQNIDTYRGKWGYFYEHDLKNLREINKICNSKFQTLTFFSDKKSDLFKFLKKNYFSGISRIVPVGSALEMNLNWDGNDIIRILSKKIQKELNDKIK